MKIIKIAILILLCLFNVLLAETFIPEEKSLSVVSQNADKINLQLQVPELQIEDINNSNFKALSMQGASVTAETGFPELPVFSAWIAIPPKGDIEIKVTGGEVITKQGLVPKPVFATKDQEIANDYNKTVYSSASLYPANSYSYSQPQIMRDFRVVQITLNPVQYIAETQELKIQKQMEVEIEIKDRPGINEMADYNGYSYAFTNLYESMIANFAYYRDAVLAPQPARVLLIYGNNTDAVFIAKLNEFVAWKRQKGYEVNIVSTLETGGSSTQAIHNYIQSQYDNVSTRPDFIILLGDTNGSYTIPTYTEQFSGYGGEGDYPYTFLAGNDYLGDAFIGRISAENLSQLDVLFTKIYAVEKNVNVSGNAGAWLNKMLLIGDTSSSGISTIYINKFIKEIAKRTNPDYTFLENYSSGFAAYINSGFNQGVAFFNYRGYISMSGWSPSGSLINGNKLPHSTILTCSTGDFENDNATSEDLIRLGTSAAPAGAITAIGMSTSGTHTTFNNCLNAGIYDGIFTYGMRSMGEALLNAKLYIKQVYGSVHDNEANYFAHWCNLMGDPTVEVFTQIPDVFNLACADVLPLGSNLLDIEVTDSSGTGVENACVTLYSSAQNIIVGKVFTDSEGKATINISGGMLNELTVTVSRHNFKPFQKVVTIDPTGSLVYLNKIIFDDGTNGSYGNGDSFATAGETIALSLEIKNTTSATVPATTAILSSDDPYITILNSESSFGAIGSNATLWSNSVFTFSIVNNLPPQHSVRFTLALTTADQNVYSFVFHTVIYNAFLLVHNYTITAGSNNILDPGEAGFLSLTIKNNSIAPVFDVYAELSSLNDLLTVSDSTSYVGSILGNSLGNTVEGFTVFARPILIPGMQMPLRLHLYNEWGFDQYAEFNIQIGQVNAHTPLGPDAYGYFIYDITDTAYPDCPVYEWIEINPSLGGSGTKITTFYDPGSSSDEGDQTGAITLQQIDLPFTFPFYGIDYNQITVCVNGFIVMGVTENGEFRNYHLPGGYGPSPMLAPFWDDLCLINDAGIYKYYDSQNHRFIIEYYKMRNGYNRSSLETFEVIFYDPVFYPTSMGQGMVKFQYQDFNNVDIGQGGYSPTHGNFCTVGIKDHTNTVGLEYTFNNQYANAAAPITNSSALLITTAPVLYESPFLILDEVIINDSNFNHIIEPGETVELGIELMNIGLSPATQVQLSAFCSSEYVVLMNAYSTYSNISGDSTEINNTPITLQIDANCPDGAEILINLHISISGNIWDFPVYITVHKPDIQYSGMYMNDCISGNGNGLIDPGETLDLIINFANNTPVSATNISGTITCLSEFVTIHNSSCIISSLLAGGISQAVYNITISPNVIVGNNLTFYLTYLADLTTIHNEQLVLSVGTTGMNADFENNNGNFVPNPSSNGWEWGVSSVAGAHSGTKIWGTRLNSQYPNYANYQLTTPSVYIGNNFMLEFWHYYNTEVNYDGGNVKISTNGGTTWTLITPEGGYPASNLGVLNGPGYDGNSGGWVFARFNLSIYANQSVQFRFTFASDSGVTGDGWFIDDVRTTGFVEFAGKVSGTVTSGNPDIDFSKVNVQNSNSWITHPDLEGNYEIYLPIGVHSLSACADGYLDSTSVEVTISLANPSAQQDFYLAYFAPVSGISYNVADSVLNLIWNPPSEPEFPLMHYEIYRRINAGAFALAGITNLPVYAETLEELGTDYYFYVVCVYSEGSSVPSEILHFNYITNNEDPLHPPLVTKLLNNYPNPFNPETNIRFTLQETAPAKLYVYNIKGQLVKKLIDEILPSGMHQIVWNGKDSNNRNVASGMYFYILESKNYSCMKKMLLLK
ncbi:MAG TPA: C25 family cysteine peptidase [Candidatus Cloacimonas sp.]|nr:C25 family cysteine peptidase [Candidatus Cloacimonas sp.]